MSPELEAKLCTSYSLIFAVEKTLCSDGGAATSQFAARGFECGDGWYDLIDVLCLNLQHATKNGAPQVVAVEVKEKLGGLRFCACGQNDEQAGMIQLAETMSARLCDVCGNRGKLVRNGWIKTRCPQHEDVNNE
ncbi:MULTISPECIES: hypothetical protein [unclassified Paraburkholderia]|uniref:hypothetical protein n=1 Tax=unclassified Paraburkholderia TaxID=2615204 RepID=UPI002AAF6A13|nr:MULTISPECIES: hypothetical protein [unclassified Paraburkholderia]